MTKMLAGRKKTFSRLVIEGGGESGVGADGRLRPGVERIWKEKRGGGEGRRVRHPLDERCRKQSVQGRVQRRLDVRCHGRGERNLSRGQGRRRRRRRRRKRKRRRRRVRGRRQRQHRFGSCAPRRPRSAGGAPAPSSRASPAAPRRARPPSRTEWWDRSILDHWPVSTTGPGARLSAARNRAPEPQLIFHYRERERRTLPRFAFGLGQLCVSRERERERGERERGAVYRMHTEVMFNTRLALHCSSTWNG